MIFINQQQKTVFNQLRILSYELHEFLAEAVAKAACEAVSKNDSRKKVLQDVSCSFEVQLGVRSIIHRTLLKT